MGSNTLNAVSALFLSLTCTLYGQASRKPSFENGGYGRLPLTFEANRGQSSLQATFLARGSGYTAFLTTDGLVLSLRTKEIGGVEHSKQPAAANHSLQIKLRGATVNPVAIGEDPQPGIVNYFIGNDPHRWRLKVPTYGRVRYRNVYPGIDLVYHGNHQQLEYDF